MSAFVSVFPRELTDTRRKLAECFATTASFLDVWVVGRDKKGEQVKTDKETIQECERLPPNCTLQRNVNKLKTADP